MKRTLYFLSVLLASCASTREPAEIWHPSNTGCYKHSILDTLYSWQDAPHRRASFRLAIVPDLGMTDEPIFMAQIENQDPSDADRSTPSFIAAWGNYESTCVVRMPVANCPQASSVHANLKSQSIPLGFDFDNHGAFVTVLHGDNYFLEYSDGQGNDNQWVFYGTDHPLQPVLEHSKDQLRICSQSALDAWNGL